ncbi:hypothetical protein ACVWZZ_005923 [Bradyrhizobium sp. LM6.10]
MYNGAEHNVLALLWEASDRICGKRLKALMPALIAAMERHGHLVLTPEIRDKLLAMSAATIGTHANVRSERGWVASADGTRRTR